MSDDRQDEPFLSRWSRQKRKAVEPQVASAEPNAAQAEPDVDLSKLPPIDDLTADSDITGFLQKGVPEALQRLALRKMWSLDPGIRDFIEVAENQWDFNAVGGVPGLFEEISPGGDMGVWLAQATPSVLPPADMTPSVPKASQIPSNVAMQQITPADRLSDPSAGSQLESIPASVSGESRPKSQPAVGVDEFAGTAELPGIEAPVRRRRHGGALPS